jgi:hypothetical protein
MAKLQILWVKIHFKQKWSKTAFYFVIFRINYGGLGQFCRFPMDWCVGE